MQRSLAGVTLALLVGMSAVVSLVGAASAYGAGWSVVPSPSGRVPSGALAGVSCPGPSSCMAVGDFMAASGTAAC